MPQRYAKTFINWLIVTIGNIFDIANSNNIPQGENLKWWKELFLVPAQTVNLILHLMATCVRGLRFEIVQRDRASNTELNQTASRLIV